MLKCENCFYLDDIYYRQTKKIRCWYHKCLIPLMEYHEVDNCDNFMPVRDEE